MTLDTANVDSDKKLYYSRVDSQVVAELIKNVLTDTEYSRLILKRICLLFRMIPTKKRIDGLCLLELIFDRIDPNVVIGVKALRQKLEATQFHP